MIVPIREIKLVREMNLKEIYLLLFHRVYIKHPNTETALKHLSLIIYGIQHLYADLEYDINKHVIEMARELNIIDGATLTRFC